MDYPFEQLGYRREEVCQVKGVLTAPKVPRTQVSLQTTEMPNMPPLPPPLPPAMPTAVKPQDQILALHIETRQERAPSLTRASHVVQR